jgi:hypothetical protein
MHPNETTIQIDVVKANALDVFRQPSGRRAYGMLFFLACDSTMVAHCISEHTDIKWLEERISEGRIFIQKTQ